MSLGQDAIRATLPIGAPGAIGEPQLVTEYMTGSDAAQVINTGSSGSVLLGSDGNLSEGHSVPLPPGTAVPWTRDGALYAAADSDATAPVQIVVSDRIGGWQPSPEVVGAAVAAQLLATGIPNVLVQDSLAKGYSLAPGKTATWHVTRYASAVVSGITNSGVNATILTLTLRDVNGDIVDQETIGSTDPALPIRINLNGAATIDVTNIGPAGGGPAVVDVSASNRQIAGRFDTRMNASAPTDMTIPSNALVAGQDYALGTVYLQGSVSALFALSNGTAARGYWYSLNPATSPTRLLLADTTECVNAPTGQFRVSKTIALGIGENDIWFHCATAGTTGLDAQFTSTQL